ADYALLHMEETAILQRVAFTARRFSERSGFTLKAPTFEARSGIGETVVLNTPFLGGALRNRARAEFNMTTHEYNRTLLSIQGRPARIEYGYDWRPRERFYGIGLGSVRDTATSYATQTEHVRGSVRWAWNRDTEESPPRTEINAWVGPRTAII